MEPVRVEFTFTPEKYTQLHRFLANRVIARRKWVLYLGALFLVSATVSSILMGRVQMLLAYILPVLLFILFWRWSLDNSSKRVYRSQPGLQHPICYTFTEENIRTQTYGGEASLGWQAFQWAEESPEWFLLFQNDRMANPVLKIGFSDPSDVDRLREMLQQKGLLKGA
jgi:hypothetical protein